MKIPFDIKYRSQIESGEYKVETRGGRPVRIICWDANGPQPIVGLIYDTDIECDTSESFCANGHYWRMYDSDCDNDLVIITPEPELTEFEERVRQVVVSTLSGETPNGSGGTMSWAIALSDDDVRKLASRLLELAKKEICKDCLADLEGYIKGRHDTLEEMSNYMQNKFTIDNPNIQKLDPDVVINTTTTGTNKAE